MGLTNWVNVLSSGSTWKAIWVTLLYGVASTVVGDGSWHGRCHAAQQPEQPLLQDHAGGVIFPLMVAPVTATIVWQLM